MALRLLECNYDVLRLILAYLSRADLRAVCLVHQHLRAIAEPFLYATIEFPKLYQGGPNPIALLLRSLSRRPELAAYVRTVSCKGDSSGHVYRRDGLPSLSTDEDDSRIATSLVESVRLDYRNSWMEGLRQGSLDAYLTAMIAQLPHLRELRLSRFCAMDNRLLGALLQSIVSSPGGLVPGVGTRLDELHTVSVIGDHFGFNTENVLPFFYLPSLRDLALSIDYPEEPTLAWPVAHPPLADKLVSLKLTSIRESHLGQLLCRLPRLRSLHWEWQFDPYTKDPYNTHIIDLDLIMSALAHVRDTLTELVLPALTLWDYGFDGPPPLYTRGSARALADMHRLKTLVIPLSFLVCPWESARRERLADCLAPNLEDLTLTDDLYINVGGPNGDWIEETQVTQEVASWLEDARASTPHLRKLGLVLEIHISSEDLAVRNRIRELARASNIELEIRHENDYFHSGTEDARIWRLRYD